MMTWYGDKKKSVFWTRDMDDVDFFFYVYILVSIVL